MNHVQVGGDDFCYYTFKEIIEVLEQFGVPFSHGFDATFHSRQITGGNIKIHQQGGSAKAVSSLPGPGAGSLPGDLGRAGQQRADRFQRRLLLPVRQCRTGREP